VLRLLAKHIHERGKLNLDEAFIHITSSPHECLLIACPKVQKWPNIVQSFRAVAGHVMTLPPQYVSHGELL